MNLQMRMVGLVALLALLCLGAAKPLRPFRTPASITSSLEESAHKGDCDQCHTMHGSGPVVYAHALIGPNENSLCDRCHDTPWAGGSYAGAAPYMASSHASGAGSVWPGPVPPARTEAGAAGKCLNCHDPHGWSDASGEIPAMTLGREEALCLTCHDGAPAASDIAADLTKPFRHPMSAFTARHTGALESLPSAFAASPVDRRHAECADCHDPHVSAPDRSGPPAAPGLSRTNLGVSRVLVQNGAPGFAPTYTFAAGADTLSAPLAEYQLCFKCHSSWTTQPTGQTDMALALNPANPSYHPVEAVGRDATISPASFAPGWSAASMTRCGDCHGSDFAGSPRGPHGSTYRHILRAPYEASTLPRTMTSNELCFSCHSYDVYANPASGAQSASRFNAPGAEAGHAQHVGERQISCYSCHVTHGSATQPHLIATGRMPGITSYTETPAGGTCAPTCHGPESYTANYGR